MIIPAVSIIIPTYNRADLIVSTLMSVKEQTFQNWECIVVDDGSSDDTARIVNSFIMEDKRFSYFNRTNNFLKGPASCRNIGISNAKGRFAIFLDSDDLLASFCLENRVRSAFEHPAFDLYIFKTQLFYDDIGNTGPIFNVLFDDYSDQNYLDSFIKDNYPFCITSVLWVTEKLKDIGGFDENLMVLEDPDLHINAFKNGLKSYTSIDNVPDSFYRKNFISSHKYVGSKLKLVKSKYIFYKKYLPLFKIKMGSLPITFFRVNVLESGSFLDAARYYWLFVKNNMFTIRQICFVPILIQYKLFRLDGIKGSGFYKISTLLLK